MGTRFCTTGPVGPQLGPLDAANLREQFNALRADLLAAAAGTYCCSDPGLTFGSSSALKVKNVDCVVSVNGLRVACPSAETSFTDTTHDIADGYRRIFVLSVATDGTTFTITPGTAVLAAATAVAPATPAGGAKLGEIEIAPLTAIFNANTDALSAAHLTVTYTDANNAVSRTAEDLTAD